MTYENTALIHTLLLNRGFYEDDPQMARVYVYTPTHGTGELYAVFQTAGHDDMHLSPFVKTYTLLMREGGVLTPQGIAWLAEHTP